MLLHNSFGMLLAEQVFGPSLQNSAGRRVFIRDLAAQHIVEDLGFIPTVAECLGELPLRPWMSGSRQILATSPSLRSLPMTHELTGVFDD